MPDVLPPSAHHPAASPLPEVAPRLRPWRLAWLLLGAVAAALLAAVAIALAVWADEDALARRLETALTESLGVPVQVGAVRWRLLPEATVIVEQAATRQTPPMRLERLVLHPRLLPLLRGEIQITDADALGVTVVQSGLSEWKIQPPAGQGGFFHAAPTLLGHLTFHRVYWTDRQGHALEYAGQVDFDPGWRPRSATVQRSGVQPAAQMRLQRRDGGDAYAVEIDIGGGTANGELRLQMPPDGAMRLDGQLQPRGLDIVQALQAFERRSIVAGKASGTTRLTAEGAHPAALLRSLHTQSELTVQPATLLRFDLAKAVRTVGTSRGGETPLDSLRGRIDTQNTGHGMRVQYSDVHARSGVLSATAELTVEDRRIDGTFAVDLVDGVVGVPLAVSGPIQDPSLSLPAAAAAGAVAGTVVAPGVGTAIGMRLGETLRGIFGGGNAAPGAEGPARPERRTPAPVVRDPP